MSNMIDPRATGDAGRLCDVARALRTRSWWNPLAVEFGILWLENGTVGFTCKTLADRLTASAPTAHGEELSSVKVPDVTLTVPSWNLGVRLKLSFDSSAWYTDFVDPNKKGAMTLSGVPRARETARRWVRALSRHDQKPEQELTDDDERHGARQPGAGAT